jgi:hypothetical protein
MQYLYKVAFLPQQWLVLWELRPGFGCEALSHCYRNSAPVENSGEMLRERERERE